MHGHMHADAQPSATQMAMHLTKSIQQRHRKLFLNAKAILVVNRQIALLSINPRQRKGKCSDALHCNTNSPTTRCNAKGCQKHKFAMRRPHESVLVMQQDESTTLYKHINAQANTLRCDCTINRLTS